MADFERSGEAGAEWIMNKQSSSAVPSPCTGVCKMENGLCLGCQRSLGEIAGWSGMADREKQTVLAQLEQRRASREKKRD